MGHYMLARLVYIVDKISSDIWQAYLDWCDQCLCVDFIVGNREYLFLLLTQKYGLKLW